MAKPPATPPFTALRPGEVVELGAGETQSELGLALASAPPSASMDARVLIRQAPAGAPALILEPAALRLPALDPGAAESPDAIGWLLPFISDWAALDSVTRTRVGTWLLAARCQPQPAGGDCMEGPLVVYPAPPAVALGDPCWQLKLLPTVLAAATTAELEGWRAELLALVRDSYPERRGPGVWADNYVDWSPRELAIPALERSHGSGALIRAEVLEFDPASIAPDRGLDRIRNFSNAPAQQILHDLLAGLRDRPERCADVRRIVEQLDARRLPRPRWTADRSSACDVLYVLCTGLEPGLAEAVAPGGMEVIETCGNGRFEDPELAAEDGFDPCVPRRRRVSGFGGEVGPGVAAHCGTNQALREIQYGCTSALDLFDVYTYEHETTPGGEVRFTRVTIEHTTVM